MNDATKGPFDARPSLSVFQVTATLAEPTIVWTVKPWIALGPRPERRGWVTW